MGKSFVINEYIKHIVFGNAKKNIVLIVPTRALISQSTLKLKNELRDEIDGKIGQEEFDSHLVSYAT